MLQVTIIQIQRIEPANQTRAYPLHHDATYHAEHSSLIRAAHHTVSFDHTTLLTMLLMCFAGFASFASSSSPCCNAACTFRGRLEQVVSAADSRDYILDP